MRIHLQEEFFSGSCVSTSSSVWSLQKLFEFCLVRFLSNDRIRLEPWQVAICGAAARFRLQGYALGNSTLEIESTSESSCSFWNAGATTQI